MPCIFSMNLCCEVIYCYSFFWGDKGGQTVLGLRNCDRSLAIKICIKLHVNKHKHLLYFCNLSTRYVDFMGLCEVLYVFYGLSGHCWLCYNIREWLCHNVDHMLLKINRSPHCRTTATLDISLCHLSCPLKSMSCNE